MTTTYVGVPTHHASIEVPADDDEPSGALFAAPLMDLADEVALAASRVNVGVLANWYPPVFFDTSAAALTNTYFRQDSTNDVFWSDTHNGWIMTGRATAETYWYGDQGFMAALTTSVTPPAGSGKYAFGVDAAPRTLLFVADSVATGDGMYVLRSDTSADLLTATWTDVAVDSPTTLAGQLNSAVVCASGRVVVVGGMDSSCYAWTSDDDGATWAAVNVASSPNYLDRVILGPGGTHLVAWATATAGANSGDTLFYSTDEGDTWTPYVTVGFSRILDGYFHADGAVPAYYFACEKTPTDPGLVVVATLGGAFGVVDPLGVVAAGGVPGRIRGFGPYLVAGLSVTGTDHRVAYSTDDGVTWALAHRLVNANVPLCLAVSSLGQFAVTANSMIQLSFKVGA